MKTEKVANVAVTLMAAVVLGTTIYDRVSPRAAPVPSRPIPPERLIGKTVEFSSTVSTGKLATVVLFVSPQCHFCTESMPFYTKLATLRASGLDSFRVVGVTPAGRGLGEEGRRYFTDHGVSVDAVAQMQFSAVGVSSTPTLALLDSSRRVVKAWTGKLPGNTEEDVIQAIRNLCAGGKGT